MEALWNFEDKWKVSTREAVLLFACSAFLVVGVCAATAIKMRARRKQLVSREPSEEARSRGTKRHEPRAGCGSISNKLMGSVRWSDASRWKESSRVSQNEGPVPLLGRRREWEGGEVGWQSHNSASPVWQRPILMGEKCELPRFSGLILYDERGRPLHQSDKETTQQQEINTAVGRTTLRDLL